ncbi:MAG: hypothetical protein WBB69_08955 [Anaerolineales bacterium]
MGVKSVHPLYGIKLKLPIKSTVSILSIPIAPRLVQNFTGVAPEKQLIQADWRLDFKEI